MNILVTSDFSQKSEVAIEYLKTFIACLKDKPDITLLHCVEHISTSRLYYGLGIDVENIILNCEEEANKEMERLKKILVESSGCNDFLVNSVVRRSEKSVGSEIVEYAANNHFDFLLIARKGHTALKHVFFGSISEYVIRHASCPVIVVPDALN
jgi:nucleotide-binding universal stress UspA family protein